MSCWHWMLLGLVLGYFGPGICVLIGRRRRPGLRLEAERWRELGGRDDR